MLSRKKKRGTVENHTETKRRKIDHSKEIDQQIKCGEFGIIQSVSICNFMCHDNLEFEFGPNINFIIGQNGSGKSAILTAIILALGGRSSVTGRYSNIKGFIKTGKQKAKIEVVLKNGGSHPFKPNLYGSTVTVVREINVDGMSTYKLKSSKGKIVSTSKDEVINLVHDMDIKINNPVLVLTQEKSRSFLTACKPDKLFQFFYQGTGLETLEKNYSNIRLTQEDAAAELKRKREMLPAMENELSAWKKILEASARINDYQDELVWANVIEMEMKGKVKEELYRKAEKDLATSKEKQNNYKEKFDNIIPIITELEKNKVECESAMLKHREEMTKFKAELEKYSIEVQNVKGKLDSIRNEEKILCEDISVLQNNINDSLLKSHNDLNEEKRRREIEIEELKTQIKEWNQDMQRLEMESDAKLKSQLELQALRDTIISKIGRYRFTLKKQEDELACLKSAVKNRVNMFGGQTQSILNEIQSQSSRFSKLPRGPIGVYVEVKDPKWNDAVQLCITPTLLQAYCCDNIQDSLVLKKILQKFCGQRLPSVLVSKYASNVYDVSKFIVRCKYPTVFEMLTIHDHVIANALIDNVHIENQILIEETNEAASFMLNPPQHCFRAILMDCSTIEVRPFRMYASEKRYRQCLLSSVGKGEINKKEQSIVVTKKDISSSQAMLDAHPHQINKIQSEIGALHNKYIKCKLLIKGASEKIKELQITGNPKNMHDMQEDLDQLQAEFENKKMEKLKYELKLKQSENNVAEIRRPIERNAKLLNEKTSEYNELCLSHNNYVQEKETLSSGIKNYEEIIKELENRLSILEKEFGENSLYIESAVKNAEEVCSRINTSRSVDELSRLLTETVKVIEQESQCSREELQAKYTEKKKTVEDAKKKLNDKEHIIERIDKMCKFRREQFQKICYMTQLCVNTSFIICLKDDYHANVAFNRKERTLTLEVQPLKSGKQLKSRKGKCSSLSGGERSYVTIAFLLAMWEWIKSPFKILDEYDVFMDSNNRKLSIDLLLYHAKDMHDSQFIFLSPLDIPQIEESPLIKIHQMPPPKRDERSS